LTPLRQFFRFARGHRLLLVNPTSGVSAKQHKGFRGTTLTVAEQRAVFRRWLSDPSAHPHEAVVGLFAILHGASSGEMRLLRLSDIDADARSIRLGNRPHPVPLDPASWTVLQRCLEHRSGLCTDNLHVMVTRGTKTGRRPASIAYMSHVLDAAGLSAQKLRTTRLACMVNTLDPKLVAAAFGMTPEAAMIYLADHVDPDQFSHQLTEGG
jgi:integrase